MNDSARKELELVRRKAGGFLRPKDVVAFAKNPKTALHTFFEWNDGAAAEQFRLAQARAVIRVCVIVSEESSEKVRAFVSLSPDRGSGAGYRAFADIQDDETMMAVLLEDAKRELQVFTRKYQRLRTVAELNGLFTAIDDAFDGGTAQKRRSEQVSA